MASDAETRARAADLVDRLRDWSRQQGADFWAQDDAALLDEAAAEIERLRAVAEYWRTRARVLEVRHGPLERAP